VLERRAPSLGTRRVVTAAARPGPDRHGDLTPERGRGAGKISVATGALAVTVGACASGIADRAFEHQVKNQVDAMLTPTGATEGVVVTGAMLDGLPGPVRRYLHYSGVVGKPVPSTVYVSQSGRMRLAPGLPWVALSAKEYFSVGPPGFVWDGTLRLGPVRAARGRDMYVDGKGKMLVKVASAFTVADACGEETDQAAMVRYLSEMVWFPAAFLVGNVSFEPVDDRSARVTLADHHRTVTGTLSVDPEGRLTDFVADRYRMVGGRFELRTWSTPVHEYGVFEGLRLPVRGRAVWKLEEGDFEYIDIWLDALRYDADGRFGPSRAAPGRVATACPAPGGAGRKSATSSSTRSLSGGAR
jgi:hypothetical protein